MKESIPHAKTVWSDSFSDIYTYTDNALKVMGYICACMYTLASKWCHPDILVISKTKHYACIDNENDWDHFRTFMIS